MELREMHASDYPQVSTIYLQGIATGQATFQTEAPDWNTFDNGHLAHSRWVVEHEATVAGWAALTPVSGRCVYAGVAEVSVYVAETSRGRGVGGMLLEALITSSEKNGIWTLQAGIFPENTASIQLHHRKGFRTVGMREKIGRMEGVWRDTLLLERRSAVVGTD